METRKYIVGKERGEKSGEKKECKIAQAFRKVIAISAFAALPILSEVGLMPMQLSSGPATVEAQTTAQSNTHAAPTSSTQTYYIEYKYIGSGLSLPIIVPIGGAKVLEVYDAFPYAYVPIVEVTGTMRKLSYVEIAPSINGDRINLTIAKPSGGLINIPTIIENGKVYLKVGEEEEYVIAEDVKITGTDLLKKTPSTYVTGFASLNIPLGFKLNDTWSLASDINTSYSEMYDNINKITDKYLSHDIQIEGENQENAYKLSAKINNDVVREQASIYQLSVETERWNAGGEVYSFENNKKLLTGWIKAGYSTSKVAVEDPTLYPVAIDYLHWDIQKGPTYKWKSEHLFIEIGGGANVGPISVNLSAELPIQKYNKYESIHVYKGTNDSIIYETETLELSAAKDGFSAEIYHTGILNVSGYYSKTHLTDFSEKYNLGIKNQTKTFGGAVKFPLNPKRWGDPLTDSISNFGIELSKSISTTEIIDLRKYRDSDFMNITDGWSDKAEITTANLTLFGKIKLGENISLMLSTTKRKVSGKTVYEYNQYGGRFTQTFSSKPSNSYKIMLGYEFGPISFITGASGSKTKPKNISD